MGRMNQLLADLLQIEVNTIVKQNMTAQKMPSLPHALHDIIDCYLTQLEECHVDVKEFFDDGKREICEKYRNFKEIPKEDLDLKEFFPKKPKIGDGRRPEAITNGWVTFEAIRLIAIYLYDERYKRNTHDQLLPILVRIRRNCDQLKYVVRTLQTNPRPVRCWIFLTTDKTRRFTNVVRKVFCLQPATEYADWDEVIGVTRNELLKDELRTKRLPLDTINVDDLARVRKFWEVSNEQVIAQTAIHIDGDVFTRLSKDLLDGKFAKFSETITTAHRQSVEISLENWHGLVKIAADLTRSTVQALVKK